MRGYRFNPPQALADVRGADLLVLNEVNEGWFVGLQECAAKT